MSAQSTILEWLQGAHNGEFVCGGEGPTDKGEFHEVHLGVTWARPRVFAEGKDKKTAVLVPHFPF